MITVHLLKLVFRSSGIILTDIPIITNRLSNPSAYDAFAINMVKTDNAASYTALLNQ